MAGRTVRRAVNLGGEGETLGVLNQQPLHVLHPAWRGCRRGETLRELVGRGHQFVVADNLCLPFADGSVLLVLTNNVPLDRDTVFGPGVQTREIKRILAAGGHWVHNGRRAYP